MSARTTGRRSAATRPAKPSPTGIRTPRSDLLFDPYTRARDELVAFSIEQEDRARVDVEDELDPREQLGQQLVELEIGERSVRYDLHAFEPPARLALRLEEGCVVDRQCGAVGDELEEVDVVLRELARSEAADVQHADRHALDEQRHAEQGLDALLAQHRIEHVGVVDVRKMTGRRSAATRPAKPFPSGMRTPRSTSSSRPTAARATSSSVSLSSSRMARCPPRGWHGSAEQLREQLVEVEMRERGVGDGLEARQVVPLDGRPHTYRLDRPQRS